MQVIMNLVLTAAKKPFKLPLRDFYHSVPIFSHAFKAMCFTFVSAQREALETHQLLEILLLVTNFVSNRNLRFFSIRRLLISITLKLRIENFTDVEIRSQ